MKALTREERMAHNLLATNSKFLLIITSIGGTKQYKSFTAKILKAECLIRR